MSVGNPLLLTEYKYAKRAISLSLNFKIQLKFVSCHKKVNLTLFYGYIHKVFIHSAQFNVGTPCCAENVQSKGQIFPCARERASSSCCDDIPHPFLQIFNPCDFGSVKLIMNLTPQEEVQNVMSGDWAEMAHLLGLPIL
jgi:hypothetical protein